jgi:transglutaminase-like putative cysteine protease
VPDYAQLPRETLQLKTGDAKDYAILAVSLLRAAGMNEEKAFVVLGTNGTTCYGWLRLNIGETWYRVVPNPYGGFYSIYGHLRQVNWPLVYTAVYYFNDTEAVQL